MRGSRMRTAARQSVEPADLHPAKHMKTGSVGSFARRTPRLSRTLRVSQMGALPKRESTQNGQAHILALTICWALRLLNLPKT